MEKIGRKIIETYSEVTKKEQDPIIKKLGIDSKMIKFTLNVQFMLF